MPVRCTLFVDVSDSVRVGSPGPNSLVRLVEIASGLSRRLLAAHDPVGLCLFNERGSTHLEAAPGRRQMLRIFGHLAQSAARPMEPSACPGESLIDPANDFCAEVYPELLHPAINRPGPWYHRLPMVIVPSHIYFLFFMISLLGGMFVLPVIRQSNISNQFPLMTLLVVFLGIFSLLGLLVTQLAHRANPPTLADASAPKAALVASLCLFRSRAGRHFAPRS